MSQPTPPIPFRNVRILGTDEPSPDGTPVWVYEGSLERFTGDGSRFHFEQRIAWPEDPDWEQVQELGLWMVARLSVNGHVLVGLRARPEADPPTTARLITPTTAPE